MGRRALRKWRGGSGNQGNEAGKGGRGWTVGALNARQVVGTIGGDDQQKSSRIKSQFFLRNPTDSTDRSDGWDGGGHRG